MFSIHGDVLARLVKSPGNTPGRSGLAAKTCWAAPRVMASDDDCQSLNLISIRVIYPGKVIVECIHPFRVNLYSLLF